VQRDLLRRAWTRTVGGWFYGDHVTIPEPTTPVVAELDRTGFVIVDVETTGWLPADAGITEIAAVRIGGGQPRAEFSALVNPGHPIPADIVALTGITDAMVSQAPPIGAVLPGFLAFASGCVLTAHNAPFDIGFLTTACGASDIAWPDFPVLDTAALARSVLGEAEVPDCKLATLASFFGAGTEPRHRALDDARATADVLQALLARLARIGVHTLAEISAWAEAGSFEGGTLRATPAPGGPRRRQWSQLSFWSRLMSRAFRRRPRRSRR
jgi:DNA polymerase-3 subunit epsilon